MKFTGHERDLNAVTGTNPAADDLDYMHARFYNPGVGRFLSVDPAEIQRPAMPQAWNKYVYALNNPLKYIDPDGLDVEIANDERLVAAIDDWRRTPSGEKSYKVLESAEGLYSFTSNHKSPTGSTLKLG